MQQFWFTVKKIKKTTSYEFDLADKKCKVDVELFRKILGICPRVPNEDFVVPPSEESLIKFLYELGYKGQINKMASMFVDHMHQPWRALATIINKCLSRKTSNNDRLRQSRVRILWGLSSGLNTIRDDGVIQRLKFMNKGDDFQEYRRAIPNTMLTNEIKQSEAYQAFISYSTGLIPPKKTRGKGLQGKKQTITPKKKSSISAEDNIIPNPMLLWNWEIIAKPTGVDESDCEPTNRPTRRRRPSGVAFRDTLNVSKKKSLDQTQKLKGIQVMSVEEQLAADTKKAIKASKEAFRLQQQTADSSEGACITPDVPNELTGKFTTSSEGVGIVPEVLDEGKGSSATKADAEIDWGSKDDSHQSNDEHVNKETDDERIDSENDDQAMIDADKIVAKKLEEEKVVKKMNKLMLIKLSKFNAWSKVYHSTVISESIKSQVPPAVNEFLGSILRDSLQKIKQEHAAKQKWPKHSTTPFDKTAENEYKQKDWMHDMDKAVAVADQSTQENRKRDDQEKDPTAGSDQGKEKKMPRKDTQPSKKSSKTKESSKDKTLPKTSKSGNDDEDPNGEATPKTNNAAKNNWFKQPPRPPTLDLEWNKCQNSLTFDELTATPIDFSKFEKNRLKLDKITKAELVGPVYNLLKGTCQSSIELEYNMEECYKALFDQLDWKNPEGDQCPFDLSKPLPLKGHQGHLTIASEYFFNNYLEYLKSTNTERKYTTSITKTKATRYEFSKHDIYSPLKILSVVSVKVNKLQGYGYLEEIVDMLLLVVQHKLFHLDGDVIVDLAVALRTFTRSLIIKKRVKDVQLGVESYQNKLNITKPQKDFPTISAKEPYTPSFDPPGVIYEDLRNHKRLMRADELFKFSDGTLKLVRDTLHHRLLNF
ncbi:hypothetical protein Tco_1346234 [Tanacetum coccineum]